MNFKVLGKKIEISVAGFLPTNERLDLPGEYFVPGSYCVLHPVSQSSGLSVYAGELYGRLEPGVRLQMRQSSDGQGQSPTHATQPAPRVEVAAAAEQFTKGISIELGGGEPLYASGIGFNARVQDHQPLDVYEEDVYEEDVYEEDVYEEDVYEEEPQAPTLPFIQAPLTEGPSKDDFIPVLNGALDDTSQPAVAGGRKGRLRLPSASSARLLETTAAQRHPDSNGQSHQHQSVSRARRPAIVPIN